MMNNVILIVEDEILEQEFLESILSREIDSGDKIITCESGVQAVELARLHRPNILLMDIMISEMDGLAAIEQIRAFLPDSYITIISAYSDFSYAQRSISLRVFEYLLKPVKPSKLKEIFHKMLEASAPAVQKSDAESDMPLICELDEQHEFIIEAVHYIDDHFTDKLTLEMVASKVFMNPKYFSHVFKKELGISFTEYIMKLRIEHACHLLDTTNYPAYRISTECGFSDASYFNRVFCAQMDMTPQSYRKNKQLSKLKNLR